MELTEISAQQIRILNRRLTNAWKSAGIVLAADDLRAPPFSPHLTLGRWSDVYVKRIEGFMVKSALNVVTETIRWQAFELHLMDSTLEPEGISSSLNRPFISSGARYNSVKSIAFTGGQK